MTDGDRLTETPDRNGAFPRLGAEHVELLTAHGKRQRTEAGQRLFAEGDDGYDFYVVAAGKVETTAAGPEGARPVAVHGPGRFLGELSLLSGQPAFMTATVV